MLSYLITKIIYFCLLGDIDVGIQDGIQSGAFDVGSNGEEPLNVTITDAIDMSIEGTIFIMNSYVFQVHL